MSWTCDCCGTISVENICAVCGCYAPWDEDEWEEDDDEGDSDIPAGRWSSPCSSWRSAD
jgi:hypothetical protein